MSELIFWIVILNFIFYGCFFEENQILPLPFNLLIMILLILSNNNVKNFFLNTIINILTDLTIVNIQLLSWIGITYIIYTIILIE